jgi:uncharacterized YigZ family protein
MGSRFFGYAYPVSSEEEIAEHLSELHKQYPDATHICHAFRLGIEGELYRAADDGEPKYSAGVPILNQIKSTNLTHVLVAVVRYYGGTNLGVPGLVKAYGGAAALALAQIPTQEALPVFSIEIEVQVAKVGIAFDAARKLGHNAHILRYTPAGDPVLQLSGRGSAAELLQTIQNKNKP